MLLKIIAVGICTTIIGIVLKQIKPEIALLSTVCGSLIIFMLAMSGAQELIASFYELEEMSSLGVSIVKPIMKVLGIGYI